MPRIHGKARCVGGGCVPKVCELPQVLFLWRKRGCTGVIYDDFYCDAVMMVADFACYAYL